MSRSESQAKADYSRLTPLKKRPIIRSNTITSDNGRPKQGVKLSPTFILQNLRLLDYIAYRAIEEAAETDLELRNGRYWQLYYDAHLARFRTYTSNAALDYLDSKRDVIPLMRSNFTQWCVRALDAVDAVMNDGDDASQLVSEVADELVSLTVEKSPEYTEFLDAYIELKAVVVMLKMMKAEDVFEHVMQSVFTPVEKLAWLEEVDTECRDAFIEKYEQQSYDLIEKLECPLDTDERSYLGNNLLELLRKEMKLFIKLLPVPAFIQLSENDPSEPNEVVPGYKKPIIKVDAWAQTERAALNGTQEREATPTLLSNQPLGEKSDRGTSSPAMATSPNGTLDYVNSNREHANIPSAVIILSATSADNVQTKGTQQPPPIVERNKRPTSADHLSSSSQIESTPPPFPLPSQVPISPDSDPLPTQLDAHYQDNDNKDEEENEVSVSNIPHRSSSNHSMEAPVEKNSAELTSMQEGPSLKQGWLREKLGYEDLALLIRECENAPEDITLEIASLEPVILVSDEETSEDESQNGQREIISQLSDAEMEGTQISTKPDTKPTSTIVSTKNLMEGILHTSTPNQPPRDSNLDRVRQGPDLIPHGRRTVKDATDPILLEEESDDELISMEEAVQKVNMHTTRPDEVVELEKEGVQEKAMERREEEEQVELVEQEMEQQEEEEEIERDNEVEQEGEQQSSQSLFMSWAYGHDKIAEKRAELRKMKHIIDSVGADPLEDALSYARPLENVHSSNPSTPDHPTEADSTEYSPELIATPLPSRSIQTRVTIPRQPNFLSQKARQQRLDQQTSFSEDKGRHNDKVESGVDVSRELADHADLEQGRTREEERVEERVAEYDTDVFTEEASASESEEDQSEEDEDFDLGWTVEPNSWKNVEVRVVIPDLKLRERIGEFPIWNPGDSDESDVETVGSPSEDEVPPARRRGGNSRKSRASSRSVGSSQRSHLDEESSSTVSASTRQPQKRKREGRKGGSLGKKRKRIE
ncbi:uncharacterized protein VTP21DRAFT_4911 [Calcarisporiella thermophila]|uniref:uncharacterized protein n=1 Tax=Calcarisporiella thermophila TaxID=911321 RepID=UPI0037439932